MEGGVFYLLPYGEEDPDEVPDEDGWARFSGKFSIFFSSYLTSI
jgi:hypothetical protein